MTNSAYDALTSYIAETSTATTPAAEAALRAARDHADEFALPAPDAATGQLLSTLAASAGTASTAKAQAIIISPASSVTGLYVLAGMPESGIISCIDPEAEHQAHAKEIFRAAGYTPARSRFLPSRPLDVLGRMASEAYQLIVMDVPTIECQAVVKAAWPLLSAGGTLAVVNSMLDGTLADASRTDRTTVAAREADAYIRSLAEDENAIVTRLPLGAGLSLLTKRA